MSKKSKSKQQQRKRRRRREERGLPSDKALRELAKTYLENQRRLWPELAKNGELPQVTDKIVGDMAAKYRKTFLGKQVEPFISLGDDGRWGDLAAAYLRYSDENSNPRSLDQQLRLQLERAHQYGYFIPWVYVFCDAAVTGTTAARAGYELAKEALRSDEAGIAVLLIDEVGRASRDMLEALSLGRLIEHLGKRLIGVSDGFDTEISMWKTLLSMFAALQEMFVDQLRAKVNRGMEDAFRRGTNTGLPALGYKLVPATDTSGNALFGKDGERVNMLAIDPDTSPWVEKAFELYAVKKWKLTDIGRHFNVHQVGGLQSWDGSRIRYLLLRRTYVGIQVYRTKSQKIDPDTGNVITERRPRSDWLVRRDRHLQIVSWKRWKEAQKRLAESRQAYSQKSNGDTSRTQITPKILVRPICGVCGDHLWLGRSGKYASLTCLNGKDGKHGCTFKGYKSVRIIETAILGFLKEQVFTEERIEELMNKANEYLAEEAAKPKDDVAPLKAEIKKVRAQRNRLAKILEEQDTNDLNTLVDRLRSHERRLAELNRQLRETEASNEEPPPIERDDVDRILCDLRGLLNEDVARAAPLINELLGPIVVRQKREDGKTRPIWIAEFTVDLVRVIVRLDSTKNCPSMDSWEYLATRSWTIQESEGVWLGNAPTYQRIAQKAAEMAGRGVSINTIATALKTSWMTVQEALEFERTGFRPAPKPTGKKTRKRSGPPKYIAIRDEVLRQHGDEKRSFQHIARELDVSEGTVRRSWDSAHRDDLLSAAAEGRSPNRGGYRHLAAEKIKRMRELIVTGKDTTREIAVTIGVSTNTVQRERNRMLADAASS